MANTYSVIMDIGVRSTKDGTGPTIDTLKAGSEVKVYQKEVGNGNVLYGNIAKSGTKWVNMQYLKMVDSPSADSEEEVENVYDDTIYGVSDADFKKLLKRALHAFGAPPTFTEEVDPYFTVPKGVGIGRAMADTWYSNATLLSLCPGTVKYLPGFSKKDRDSFIAQLSDAASGGMASKITGAAQFDTGGPLYTFNSAYREYMNVVNGLARICATMLGIGEVKNLYKGMSVPLNRFDYGYFTTSKGYKTTTGLAAVFEECQRALNTAVTDDAYIHFFINHTGSSTSESIQTQQGPSALEKMFGDSSGLSDIAQNIQFLLGSSFDPLASNDIDEVIKSVGDGNDLLSSFGKISENYLKGGRLVFPQMITGMDYAKSKSVELTFTSLYGDKRSIFRYVILPTLHLLAMACPRQVSSNMYTYPFLVRAFQRSDFNTDLAFISNLDITRGGQDESCWTLDGLPTQINVRFTITPLYSNMMVSSTAHPLRYMSNTSLLEYLGNMCGIDLKANNWTTKAEIGIKLLQNKVIDIPTNAARAVADLPFINQVRDFLTIKGG